MEVDVGDGLAHFGEGGFLAVDEIVQPALVESGRVVRRNELKGIHDPDDSDGLIVAYREQGLISVTRRSAFDARAVAITTSSSVSGAMPANADGRTGVAKCA